MKIVWRIRGKIGRTILKRTVYFNSASDIHTIPSVTVALRLLLGLLLLANVNSPSRSLYAIARPSVVCNVRAPYSGGSHFRQYFYGVRYLGHPLTSDRPRGSPPPGELNTRG